MKRRGLWSGLMLAVLITAGVRAQTACDRPALELRLLCTVYRWDGPVASAYFETIDATAYPMFAGLTAMAWGGVLAGRLERPAAERVTLATAATTVLVFGLKALARRNRPFDAWDDIAPRGDPPTSHAFPSGHAALAFTLATAWGLEVPRIYVIVPAYVWATSVAVGRVWKGVHYPTDVLAGAVLGAGVAWTVHRIWR
ncbi:phosphatase PAP2 family protein [Rhodothermus marinus]|uniref:phosphatase PAP2 family protein n=1 Tax=Rhodothermus marinus TaxID=29549 RepID=UPI001DF70884|nr:phosphatase PAP2 family protein [Rhodothermus marinus]MBO2492644.1 phosphatase PAP2 family protein [Rhodothermus marinus]